MIAATSHIRLIGRKSDENKILDLLTHEGLFEPRKTDSLFAELSSGDDSLYKEIKQKQGKVAFALDFLKQRRAAMASILSDNAREVKAGGEAIEYKLDKPAYGEARTLITSADFSDARAKEYDLLNVCDALEKLSFSLVDTKSRQNAIAADMRAYEPFAALEIPFSTLGIHGGIEICAYYSRTGSGNVSDILDELDCAYEVIKKNGVLVVAAAIKAAARDVDKAMSALGFSKCAFRDDCTAAEKLDGLAAEASDCKRHMFELTKQALDYERFLGELRILYDVYELEAERAEADMGFCKTGDAFVLEGWIPEADAIATAERLKSEFDAFVQLLAPEERDMPPTLVINNKVVKPYEQITNMYSPPDYREFDPNPIMAIFYFIFFGLMIGDAAYGLILAVAGLALGFGKKFDGGVKSVMLLVGMGGVSAVIWGVLFGGYFAIDFGDKNVALWFNPLNEPMKMLLLSVALGCVQMTVGYIIKFVRLCRDGKPFSAVFDAGSIIMLFGALACLAVGMLVENAPKGLNIAGIVLAATGLALIIIFGGRNNKNVFGKVFGGFKGVYGLVNLLSDILSYCRLFGLGLASGAIGLAFNTLGGILFDIPVVGYAVGVIILIPLHAFNIGIGVLGAYVHNARLQFLEYYGKFYDGGGRLFTPLGYRTKYIRFS